MMKKVLLCLLALCLALPAAVVAEEAAPDYTTGSPWICSNQLGVLTADTPAELKDDFYLAVNKEDILKLKIPEGYPFAGTVMDNVLKQSADLRNLFANPKPQSHDEQLAADLYGLLMDWDTRNALGVAPLKEKTDALEAVDSLEGMTAYLTGTPLSAQLWPMFTFSAGPGLEDASVNELSLDNCSLLMDDAAEYAQQTEYGTVRLRAYSDLALKMLGKLGYTEEEAKAKLENCLAFERLVAPGIPSLTDRKKPDYANRMIGDTMSLETLQETAGAFPAAGILSSAGISEVKRCVPECGKAYFEKLAENYTAENLDLIRDFQIVHGAISMAVNLDRESYEWYTETRNGIRGASGILEDATAFSARVDTILKWPVARLYCSTYITPEYKQRIADIVDRAVDAYHGILSEADFLSEETRQKAIEKLDAMSRNVLYPDDWAPYSMDGLEFAPAAEGGTLPAAMEAIDAWKTAKTARDLTLPADKTFWEESPTAVNCFYDPARNGIYICAAFAQGRMFSEEMRDEEALAGIGTVIGHEISHAFDSFGSQFDKDGNKANWWTGEDYEKYREKNKKLEEYYSAITAWEGMPVNGAIVTGETCADMGGMKCMLRIASGNPDFDYDLFFRAYAKLWLSVDAPQRIISTMRDEHPLDYIRCNTTLQHFDVFINCYGLRDGDRMYLAPDRRVNIW